MDEEGVKVEAKVKTTSRPSQKKPQEPLEKVVIEHKDNENSEDVLHAEFSEVEKALVREKKRTREERIRVSRTNMDEEAKAQARAKNALRVALKRAQRTPEQIAADRKANALREAKRRAQRSEEEKAIEREKRKAREERKRKASELNSVSSTEKGAIDASVPQKKAVPVVVVETKIADTGLMDADPDVATDSDNETLPLMKEPAIIMTEAVVSSEVKPPRKRRR
jgi:hypothetical protein